MYGYLCKKCFMDVNGYTEDVFNRAVREHRLPRWEWTQSGTKTVCERCGKETVVYG